MSGILALASAVAGMDRSALQSLVRRRRVQSPASVLDPIGLATELLRPESVARTLAGLDRRGLAALLDPRGAAPSELALLTGLGLLGIEERHGGSDPVPLPEVEAVLRDALQAAGIDAGSLTLEADEPAPAETPGAAAADGSHSWYATGLTAVAQAAESLRALRERPGRLNRTGTVAVATVRALSETTRIEADPLARTLTALDRAALTSTAVSDAALIPSSRAPAWLDAAPAARWAALAEATLVSMSPELSATLRSGDTADLAGAAAALPQRFPLLPEAEFAAARSFAADAEHLGLTVRGRLSEVALRLLAGERAEAGALIDRIFPAASPGVYVQPDLSVVVPGPLSPGDEALLASLTAPEHVGVASTRRITEASVSSALQRGLPASEARAAFDRLSLTGIPQPLDYLLGSLAERLGSIIVDEHDGDGGRTRITVARPDLAETLLVDRALQHLQLRRAPAVARSAAPGTAAAGETTLFSRLRIDHVLAALADARYHATGRRSADPAPGSRTATPAAAGASVAGASVAGAPRDDAPAPPEDPAAASSAPAEPQLSEPLAALVDRVFAAAHSQPGAGDFTRRLELAIRDRSPVRVTAEARGESRTFTLLPVSVNAGRLRASDAGAGVERTLPISTITAVDPA